MRGCEGGTPSRLHRGRLRGSGKWVEGVRGRRAKPLGALCGVARLPCICEFRMFAFWISRIAAMILRFYLVVKEVGRLPIANCRFEEGTMTESLCSN